MPAAAMKATYRGLPLDLIVDVRTKLEYWFGHLDGAECIQLESLEAVLAERREIVKTSRILLYCASGGRSAAAAKMLRGLGYKNVIDAGPMSHAEAECKWK